MTSNNQKTDCMEQSEPQTENSQSVHRDGSIVKSTYPNIILSSASSVVLHHVGFSPVKQSDQTDTTKNIITMQAPTNIPASPAHLYSEKIIENNQNKQTKVITTTVLSTISPSMTVVSSAAKTIVVSKLYSSPSPLPCRTLSAKENPRNKYGHVKRPMNAFMVWAKYFRPKLSRQMVNATNAEVSIMLGRIWNAMSGEDKVPYFEEAERIKMQHKMAYPEWVYRPQHKRSPNSPTVRAVLNLSTGNKSSPIHCLLPSKTLSKEGHAERKIFILPKASTPTGSPLKVKDHSASPAPLPTLSFVGKTLTDSLLTSAPNEPTSSQPSNPRITCPTDCSLATTSPLLTLNSVNFCSAKQEKMVASTHVSGAHNSSTQTVAVKGAVSPGQIIETSPVPEGSITIQGNSGLRNIVPVKIDFKPTLSPRLTSSDSPVKPICLPTTFTQQNTVSSRLYNFIKTTNAAGTLFSSVNNTLSFLRQTPSSSLRTLIRLPRTSSNSKTSVSATDPNPVVKNQCVIGEPSSFISVSKKPPPLLPIKHDHTSPIMSNPQISFAQHNIVQTVSTKEEDKLQTSLFLDCIKMDPKSVLSGGAWLRLLPSDPQAAVQTTTRISEKPNLENISQGYSGQAETPSISLNLNSCTLSTRHSGQPETTSIAEKLESKSALKGNSMQNETPSVSVKLEAKTTSEGKTGQPEATNQPSTRASPRQPEDIVEIPAVASATPTTDQTSSGYYRNTQQPFPTSQSLLVQPNKQAGLNEENDVQVDTHQLFSAATHTQQLAQQATELQPFKLNSAASALQLLKSFSAGVVKDSLEICSARSPLQPQPEQFHVTLAQQQGYSGGPAMSHLSLRCSKQMTAEEHVNNIPSLKVTG